MPPEEFAMPDQTTTDHLAVDREVTITITGRVVHVDGFDGALIVEYVKPNGFTERIVARADGHAVTAAPAPAPDPAERQRRIDAHRRVADACLDPDEVARILAAMPYQTATPTA